MKIKSETLEKLNDFLVTNIESKVLEGITYALAIEGDSLVEKGKDIKTSVLADGFDKNELFRVFKVSNGYVFDMDMSVAKFITQTIASHMGDRIPQEQDIIGSLPEKRRQEDMIALAKYCKSQHSKGVNKLEVALFSRNIVPKIVITGKDSRGKDVVASYNAYAIRHWDIDEVNNKYLSPYGIAITSIKPCEVLPSRTGVRFELTLGSLY